MKSRLETSSSPFVRCVDGGRDLLWIVASHVDLPRGKFGQSRVFARKPGSKVFLNCDGNSWYQQGVGPDLPSFDALLHALVEHAARFKQVRVVGHSMGAYLALVLQHEIDAQYCFVSSPEPILGIEASRSDLNRVRIVPEWRDLYERYAGRKPLSPGVAFYGAYDPVDAYFLSQIERHFPLYCRLLVVPHHHGVTEYLAGHGRYGDLLEGENGVRAVYRNKLAFYPSDFGTKHAFKDYYELYRAFRARDLDALKERLAKRPKWHNAGYLELRARALSSLGRYEEAVEVAETAIDWNLSYGEPIVTMARALRRSGNRKKALWLLAKLEGAVAERSVRGKVEDALRSLVPG